MRGLPWQPAGQWLQPESLVTNVLCTAHNTALAPYDEFVSALDDDLERIKISAERGAVVSTVTRFNGHNLEGWLVKALCGLVAGGIAARADASRAARTVPEPWVRCLFGNAELIPNAGLYVSGAVGETWSMDQRTFGLGPLFNGTNVVGIQAQIHWLKLTLALRTWKGRTEGAIDADSIYRPVHLRLNAGRAQHELGFEWQQSSRTGITLAYTAPERASDDSGDPAQSRASAID